jgi:hypothetical protein
VLSGIGMPTILPIDSIEGGGNPSIVHSLD